MRHGPRVTGSNSPNPVLNCVSVCDVLRRPCVDISPVTLTTLACVWMCCESCSRTPVTLYRHLNALAELFGSPVNEQ